jgi:Fe-S-cluster containining protein
MSSRRKPPDPDASLVGALERLYAEADALYRGYRCPGTTECCRFSITGREPYVTSLELWAVRRALGAQGLGGRGSDRRDGPLSPRRRALPLEPGEGTCPLLARGGRCAIYPWRPLGCRTFWCDRAQGDAPVRQPTLNGLVRRLQELASVHQPGGELGRPLRRALGER